MPETKRLLKVFLCHASQDKPNVRELSQRLFAEGWIDPWLDEKKLLPGQDWRLKIEEAVETSDIVIICLSSNSVSKEGFVQKELRYAREIALEKPDETIFLVPLRLDDCTVPRGLRFYQWADYFGENKDETYDALVESLKLRHDQKLRIEDEERARQEKEKREREATEKVAREKAEREAAEKTALEKAEREAAENAARENAKRETAERAARAKVEREAAEKAAREKAEREAAEKAEREEAIREATEKAERQKKEKTAQEKEERKATKKTIDIPQRQPATKIQPEILKKLPSQENKLAKEISQTQRPEAQSLRRNVSTQVIFWIIGIIVVVVTVIGLSSLNNKGASLTFIPTPTHTSSPTKTPEVRRTPTKSFTSTPGLTPTNTSTPTVIPLPTEITDAKGVQMMLVPASEFTMGSDSGYGQEKPARLVNVGNFYIDKYEVTNAEYQKCVIARECNYPFDTKLGDLTYYRNKKYDSYPVVWVTKENAELYCTSRSARLPTSAEWEKAARGIDARTYPWGEQTDFELRANGYGIKDGFQATAPVGSFPLGVSPYGVFDMIGNVAEFVKDNEESFFVRGAGWNGGWFNSSNLSPTYFYDSIDWSYYGSSEINSWTGFRCVRDANQ